MTVQCDVDSFLICSNLIDFYSLSLFSEEIKAKEDGGERIRLLQDKINEMRKMYSSLKAEVASIDRKRKRLKKKRGLFLFLIFFYNSNHRFSLLAADSIIIRESLLNKAANKWLVEEQIA